MKKYLIMCFAAAVAVACEVEAPIDRSISYVGIKAVNTTTGQYNITTTIQADKLADVEIDEMGFMMKGSTYPMKASKGNLQNLQYKLNYDYTSGTIYVRAYIIIGGLPIFSDYIAINEGSSAGGEGSNKEYVDIDYDNGTGYTVTLRATKQQNITVSAIGFVWVNPYYCSYEPYLVNNGQTSFDGGNDVVSKYLVYSNTSTLSHSVDLSNYYERQIKVRAFVVVNGQTKYSTNSLTISR